MGSSPQSYACVEHEGSLREVLGRLAVSRYGAPPIPNNPIAMSIREGHLSAPWNLYKGVRTVLAMLALLAFPSIMV
ncbi:MAG: hypothetical protein AAFS10_04165, partial [Myxococcota bacterium]